MGLDLARRLRRQGGPLLHPEAVLFVDDGECQVLELDPGLEESLGSDHALDFTRSESSPHGVGFDFGLRCRE